MSVGSSGAAKAGRFIFSFAAGAAACGGCMAAFAMLMAKQGLALSFAWPLAAAAVSIGSALSGWLFALLQKQRGLLCGALQGALFAGILLAIQAAGGSALQGRQLAAAAIALFAGAGGGLLRALAASRSRI